MEFFKLKELIFSLDLEVGNSFEGWNLKRFIFEINQIDGKRKVMLMANLLIRLLGLKEILKEHLEIIESLACFVKEIDYRYQEIFYSGLRRLIELTSEGFSGLKNLIKVLKIISYVEFYRKNESLSYINFKIENKLWSRILSIEPLTDLYTLKCLFSNIIELQNLGFNLENHLLPLIPNLTYHIKNIIEGNYDKNSSLLVSYELCDLILKLESSSVTISQIASLKISLKDYKKSQHPISDLSTPKGYLQKPIKICKIFIPPYILDNPHTYLQFEFASYGTAKTELSIEKTKYTVLIKIYDNYRPEALEMIYNEIKLLQFLSDNSSLYKNFIKLIGFNIESNRISIVLENFYNNLEQFILRKDFNEFNGFNGFNEVQLRLLFKSLLESFEFMEKNEICHQNISLENILIDPNWVLKISGFKTLPYNDLSTFQNTYSDNELKFEYYPECNRENLTWPQMVNNDIYALGVVFLQMAIMEVYIGGEKGGKLSLELEIEKVHYNWAKVLIGRMIRVKKFGSFTQLLELVA